MHVAYSAIAASDAVRREISSSSSSVFPRKYFKVQYTFFRIICQCGMIGTFDTANCVCINPKYLVAMESC